MTLAVDGRVELRTRDHRGEPEPRLRSPQRFVYARGEQRVYVFALGAVVVLGTDALDPELRAFVEHCTRCTVLPETVDHYRLAIDARAERGRVEWERIVIPRLDDEVVDAVALALARSAGLERYERGAEPLLEQGLGLARALAGHGRTPFGVRPMIQRIAGLTVSRLELARWFVHLDRPERAWEDPVVDHLYDLLVTHLELAERHEALMHRIGSLEHGLSAIVGIWEGRRSRFLEWAIVWLIVVEIVMALVETLVEAG